MTIANVALSALLAGLASAACGADDSWTHATWTVDPATSSVKFHGSSTLHNFDGTAKLVSGTLHLDGAHSTGAVIADAASMDTAESGRDKTMHTETMAVQTWPTIRFDLNGFTANADASGGNGNGTWTMHGATQPITIPVTLVPAVAGAPGPHLKSHFVIDISTWNIKPPRAMLVITVDKQVTIDLDLALMPAPAATAGAATVAVPATAAVPATSAAMATAAATAP